MIDYAFPLDNEYEKCVFEELNNVIKVNVLKNIVSIDLLLHKILFPTAHIGFVVVEIVVSSAIWNEFWTQ